MKPLRRPWLPTRHSVLALCPVALGCLCLFARSDRRVRSPSARVLLTGITRCPVAFPRRPTVLPGSQRTPLCLRSALRSRPDLDASPSTALRCCPRTHRLRGLQQQTPFRDSITQLQHSLSTLRAVLLDDYARLVSGWWLTVSGWDWIPTEFFRAVSGLRLPCSWAFPGATMFPGSAGGYPPAPPQTRTSPIRAYGSSGYDFAA